jgi:hypothetical protein
MVGCDTHSMNLRCPLTILFLVGVFLIGGAQATTLLITVQDGSTSDPLNDASIYISGEYVGRTSASGEFVYDHSETESLNLKVTKTGYDDWIDLISEQETSVLVQMYAKKEVLTIYCFDADTFEPVQNALVKVAGEGLDESERTDSTGRAEFEVVANEQYNIEMRATRYETRTETVEMGSTPKEVEYWLYRSDQYVIKVTDAESKTPLEGSKVYIDDRLQGETDSEGILSLYLEREDSYLIRVEKPLYQTYLGEQYVSVGDALFAVELSKSLYPVSISVFDTEKKPIEGADVYLDGSRLGTTDSYGKCGLSNVVAGTHQLEVRRTGYQTVKQSIAIENEGEDIVVELEYVILSAAITVEDNEQKGIPNATVLVDGTEVGTTDAGGQIAANLSVNQVYNFTAVRDGYVTASVEKEIPLESTTFSVTITMEPGLNLLLIGGVILVVVAGILIYFGTKRGMLKRRRPPGRKKAKF